MSFITQNLLQIFCSKRTDVYIHKQIKRNSSLSMWKTPWRASSLTLCPYAVLRGEKQPTSRGCRRWDVCAGIQRLMILFSVQYWSNSGVAWLPWPSRISRRQAPVIRGAVCLLKCFSHSNPSSSVVQPLSLSAITQSAGRLRYQLAWWSFLDRMMTGGIDQLDALIALIAVIQSRLLGYIITAQLIVLELIITFNIVATPIINPVLLKLQLSQLRILYA